MADRLSIEARSALMGRIHSKDTKPEMVVRRMLHGMGYRYVLHDRRLPGSPDIVFPARKKIVLVHGCFWHGHHCGRGFRPARNAQFWSEKIDGNRARDRKNVRRLRAEGWSVLTVWECATRRDRLAALERRLALFLLPN
jgi:DNA mismatch endonuclease (patch repair protein)